MVHLLQGVLILDSAVLDKQLQTRYIYIDNRPVSLSRNPAKHFLKILRESFRSDKNLQFSFIYLNFHCDVDKIKYDCNMDPSKSEIVFEQFEIICGCFKRFLNKFLENTLSRSPSPASVEFFSQENSRLLSPPLSNSESPVRNVYAVDENEMYRSNEQSTPQKVLRQTRLDEFRSGYIPTQQVNRDSTPWVPQERPGDSIGNTRTIRSIMGCMSEIDGINLTQGIVSGRQPRQIVNSDKNVSLDAFRSHFNMDSMRVTPNPTQMGSRDVDGTKALARQLSAPTAPKNTATRVIKSPRTPRPRKLRDPVFQSSHPQTPKSILPPIKYRSISESPDTLETSLNPWTIAALLRDPKRPRLERSNDNDIFLKTVQPDMDLQTIVVVCNVSMEEISVGQISLLSHCPPVCDLVEFYLQCCS
jgi:DNA mismatch repair ATPase MutL